jgi:hypothetical protein
MKYYRVLLVMLMVVFFSACDSTPKEAVSTVFPDTGAAVHTLISTGRSTPESVVATIIETLSTVVTQSTTFICAFNVSGCPGGSVDRKCFSYYEIIEGTTMTDAACDRLIQTIQAGLDADPDPDTGEIGRVVRVDSYPTSPIICNKAYAGHSTLTIVDPGPETEVSQRLCSSLP